MGKAKSQTSKSRISVIFHMIKSNFFLKSSESNEEFKNEFKKTLMTKVLKKF